MSNKLNESTKKSVKKQRQNHLNNASDVAAVEHVIASPVNIAPLHRLRNTGKSIGTRSIDSVVDEALQTALTSSEIETLSGYIKQAEENSHSYYVAADYNRRRNNLVNWILLVVAALTCGGSTLYNFFVPKGPTEADGEYAFRITMNIVLVIIAILKGWQQAYSPEAKAMNFEMTGDDFANYAREWSLRLAQGIDDRRERVLMALVSAQTTLFQIESAALPLHTNLNE